jgi:hypothetical protein
MPPEGFALVRVSVSRDLYERWQERFGAYGITTFLFKQFMEEMLELTDGEPTMVENIRSIAKKVATASRGS